MILELHKFFLFIYKENARQAYLEVLLEELNMPNLYDDLDEHFELFLDSIKNSIELCSSVKQCNKKKPKPP